MAEALRKGKKRSEHLTYVTDVVQPEEINRWKSINTHTHLFSKYFKPYRLSGILNKNSDLDDIIKVRVFYKTNP